MGDKELHRGFAKLTISLHECMLQANEILDILENRKIKNERSESDMSIVSDRIQDVIVLLDAVRGGVFNE